MRALLTGLILLALAPAALAATGAFEDRSLPRRSGVSSASRIEPRFSTVAASLSGKRSEVRCWSKADWARINGEHIASGDNLDYVGGFYRPPGTHVQLEPSICADLVALVYRHLRPTGAAAVPLALAVDTLAHESMHRRGFVNEATTECYAVQLVYRTARELGIPTGYAATLHALNWRVGYPAHPSQYHSPQCRNGGRLDLNPSSSRWP
ncbi:MAG: hypothetical protein QOE36_2534 [Gaiellaceae bacterium]|nr:hypothetical protein [Gaiellaceae bacterium]